MALQAHTAEAAYALRIEDRLGTLRPGTLADVTVTDVGRDPAADQVREAATWLTAVGGQIVHRLDTL